MLSLKLERAIFLLIFVICFIVCIYFVSQIKANDLPINVGMTPEQVIEAEYKEKLKSNFEYKYIIKDYFMFVCTYNNTDYCDLDHAFRNDKSGFMFGVPGLFSFPIGDYKNKYINMSDGSQLGLTAIKMKASYYISITDPLKRNINLLCDRTEMERLTFDNVKNQYWICEIKDLDQFEAIEGNYNAEIIHVIDKNELIALFGEAK